MGQQTEGSPGVPHAPDTQVLLGSADFSFGGGARTPEVHLALNHEPLTRQAHCGQRPLLGLTGEAGEPLAAAGKDEPCERKAQLPGARRNRL
eukprot:8455574-Alexandrium_andersonii.AAC.1